MERCAQTSRGRLHGSWPEPLTEAAKHFITVLSMQISLNSHLCKGVLSIGTASLLFRVSSELEQSSWMFQLFTVHHQLCSVDLRYAILNSNNVAYPTVVRPTATVTCRLRNCSAMSKGALALAVGLSSASYCSHYRLNVDHHAARRPSCHCHQLLQKWMKRAGGDPCYTTNREGHKSFLAWI